MVLNYIFLKSKNGMYYYAENYLEGTSVYPEKVLGGDFNEGWVRKIYAITLVYIYNLFKGYFVYTPTIHPLPFLSRQLVVCHDSYPFLGRMGRFKKKMLCLSLYTSKCKVGYINHSDSKAFVDSLLISDSRKIYLPNLVAEVDALESENKKNRKYINIALVGTDSDKKRYDFLFESIIYTGKKKFESCKFYLYGSLNDYAKSIVSRYSECCDLKFIESSSMDLNQFLYDMDMIVSVAKNEGFGRPIAFAIQQGLPALLIDDPVFHEFFSDSAYIFESEMELVNSIMSTLSNHEVKKFPDERMIEKFNFSKREFASLCRK